VSRILTFFYFVTVFLFKKHSLKIPAKSSRSTCEVTDTNYFTIRALDFIMKVADCRATPYPLRAEHITLGSAYSDTAAVKSCSIGRVSTLSR